MAKILTAKTVSLSKVVWEHQDLLWLPHLISTSKGDTVEKKAIVPEIGKTINGRYVHAEDIAEILSLGLVGKFNVILFGPGGHAKSELAEEVASLVQGADHGTIMFGEGMTEDKLWGGINLNKLNDVDDKRIEYYLERSFLNWHIAVFEELFDAPVNVLLALKYALTARAYKSGWQQFPMKTFSVIAATNREPYEVSTMSPSAHALIERFLQFRVAWDSYSTEDFTNLFSTVENRNAKVPIDLDTLTEYQNLVEKVSIPNTVKETLSDLLGKAASSGITISPRTAVLCLRLVRTAAAIKSRSVAEPHDIVSIKFVPGCDQLTGSLSQELRDSIDRANSLTIMDKYRDTFFQLKEEVRVCPKSPIRLLQVAKRIENVWNELSRERFPDSMQPQRSSLIENFAALSAQALDSAKSCTRV